MKYRNIICFFILTIFIANPSSFSQVKMSPTARLLVNELKSNKEKANQILSQNKYCGALLKVNDLTIEKELQALGAKIGTKAKNIWSVSLPIEQLEQISNLAGIDYIQLDEPYSLLLDQTRKLTRVDSVQNGIFLDKKYSGKNVIVGVIDRGFDFTNPILFDTVANKTRISRVWLQMSDTAHPFGYTYGRELSNSDDIVNIHRDSLLMSHATHVTGIAAGNGYGTNGLYSGIAPNAEIVIVSSDTGHIATSGSSHLLDGVAYILRYADSVQKPVVINMSLGNAMGPGDGSSLFCQGVNNLLGAGKIMVIAAGNNGADTIHFYQKFTDTDSMFKTFLDFSPYLSYKELWVNFWGEKNKDFSVSCSLFDSLTKSAFTESKFYSTSDSKVDKIVLVGSDQDTCIINVTVSHAEYNGKPRIYMDIINKSKNQFLITGKGTEGELHVWNGFVTKSTGYAGKFLSHKFSWAKNGNTDFTVNDYSVADSVISVAAYTSKVSWTDVDGKGWQYTGQKVGAIAPFSSHGPRLDGLIKPEIAAPGFGVVSSINSFDTSYLKGGSNRSSVVRTYNKDDKTYSYTIMSGTSMASPVVTGIVALMLEAKPGLTPSDIKQLFKKSAIVDSYVKDTNLWGYGKINAYKMLQFIENKVDVKDEISDKYVDLEIFPNPNDGNFNITAAGLDILGVEVINYLGESVYQISLSQFEDNEQLSVNIPQMETGLYFIKVITNHGNYFKKIVKE